MRAMWPGIDGNHGGSNNLISNMRKRAVQASRFMLQMMQSTLYQKETNEHVNSYPEENTGCVENSDGFEAGQEGLALRIATEVPPKLAHLGKMKVTFNNILFQII